MLDIRSLQSLFLKHIERSSTHFDYIVSQFFEHQRVPAFNFLEEGNDWKVSVLSETESIECWKRLLAVNVLCDLSQSHQAAAAGLVRLTERQPWNQNSQFFRSLVALNHAFARMPIPEVGPHLLESGAALIDLHEYCPWLSLPYTPHHFEFGIFLSILALWTKREDLKQVALRLAQWQFNTLDAAAVPLAGLFVRENEGRNLQYLYLSYLLFRGAAALSGDSSFSAAAEAALKSLEERMEDESEQIPVLWPLLERWLDRFECPIDGALKLPEAIYDPSTALVGYRSAGQHVFCTLHGEHTGLGTLRHEDIEIVNYGPQYLPLGDCLGFGVEGNALSDHGMRRSVIEWRPHSFVLKGCTRLVDQPSSSPFGIGQFRGIWMDVTQEYKKPHLYLRTAFLGLNGWESVAFSFFVKAKRCRTQSRQSLQPRTLDRYEGEVQTLSFEGESALLELRPLFYSGTMQVVPLAGGQNFWGADFLVSYPLLPEQSRYEWHIGPHRIECKR